MADGALAVPAVIRVMVLRSGGRSGPSTVNLTNALGNTALPPGVGALRVQPGPLKSSGRCTNIRSLMIVAVLIPRFPLLIALLRARRPLDAPVALGPPPGAPDRACTPAAEAQGVRPGLRVGEALARCPGLDLVVPDPDAAAEAAERILCRLEAAGFAVEPVEPGRRRLRRAGHAAPARRAHRRPAPRAGRRCRWAPTAGWAPPRRSSAPSRRPARRRPGAPRDPGPDELTAFLAPLPAGRLPPWPPI